MYHDMSRGAEPVFSASASEGEQGLLVDDDA